MRIAVIGGTGIAGRHTVEALARAGHDAVVLSRSRGVDVTTGKGLDEALAGIDTVIDVTSVPVFDAEATPKLFATATRNILAVEKRVGVRHHVLLSIVGIDRLRGNPHLAGKRVQEEILGRAAVPLTIQRATQFFEFANTVIDWMRHDDVLELPPLLLQPIAAADAGRSPRRNRSSGKPQGRAPDWPDPRHTTSWIWCAGFFMREARTCGSSRLGAARSSGSTPRVKRSCLARMRESRRRRSTPG